MGFLEFLGLDELAERVNELTTGIDELRDEIISSVVSTTEEVKDTVNDILPKN